MTRKRVGQGLIEAFSTTCDSCNGRGIHIHTEPVKMKAPMPQVNAQSNDQPDIESDVDDDDQSSEVVESTPSPKGKRRRRAATSGVITA
jgi:ribonuclease E